MGKILKQRKNLYFFVEFVGDKIKNNVFILIRQIFIVYVVNENVCNF